MWTVACGREDLLLKLDSLYNTYRLCGAHFEAKHFLNELRNRLQPQAVPTIFPSMEGSLIAEEHNYSVFIPNVLPTSQGTSSEPEMELPPGNIRKQLSDAIFLHIKCGL